MAIPDITLGNGQILLHESSSTLGIVMNDMNLLRFGVVDAVYATADRTVAGDYVMFNPKEAQKFVYGSTVYYIVMEQNISGTEPPPA